jgi:hypothetical protein
MMLKRPRLRAGTAADDLGPGGETHFAWSDAEVGTGVRSDEGRDASSA